MKVKLRAIRNKGDFQSERVVLDVLGDIDIGNYVIFSNEAHDAQTYSNVIKEAFWFPDKEVKAGDLVVLYTKGGKDKEKVNKNRSTTHFFYWEKQQSVWNKRGNYVVVAELFDWFGQAAIDDEKSDAE